MKRYTNISNYQTGPGTVVTIGTFDGVHLGHQKILDRVTGIAKAEGLESLVLTFFPHPRMVLQAQSSVELLQTIDERAAHIEAKGIDHLVVHPFDQAFSRLTAEQYVKGVLVDQFNVKKICIGYDHRFGCNRTADITDLIEFAKKYGFEVEQISAQEIDEVSVSSTKIRKALQEGNVAVAKDYLGYSYQLSGNVVKGQQLGRTIGFPTANVQPTESYKLVPMKGVYAVTVTTPNGHYLGMCNIGTRPTVSNDSSVSIEVHLLDFQGDLYDQNLQLTFVARLREEQKFSDIETLKAQLAEDKASTLAYFNAHVS